MRKILARSLLILLAVLIPSQIVVAGNMTPARVYGQIAGQIVYHERMAMPLGAVIRVTLEDVSRADVRAEVLGEQIITPEGGFPIPFTLQYNPNIIDQRFSYTLRAQIRDVQGKLLYTSTAHTGVLTRGFSSDDIRLVVQPVVVQAVAREINQLPRSVFFDCSGLEVMVRYGTGEAAIWLHGRYAVLSQVRAASGVRYEGDGVLFWNKGDEALLEVDGVRYPGCKQIS